MSLTGINRLPLSFPALSFRSKGSFGFSCPSIHTNGFSLIRCNHRSRLSVSCLSHNGFSKSDDAQRDFSKDEDLSDKNKSRQSHLFNSKELLKKLKKYGIAGILSYGLLNTVYYTIAFLLVWIYVAPAPVNMGYAAAVQRFLKVMAMVWAGSQVTKLIRAGGALALAPFVDKGLSWFTVRFKFESQGKACIAIVGMCLGLSMLLFLAVTLLWA